MRVDLSIAAPIALDVCFEITGFTALLGRSGAGKTTLLRALGGLGPATARVAGRVGYLPQSAALFPHLTALENTAYALRGPRRFGEALALLEALGLADLAHRPAPHLSGGQAQRIALARALAPGPALMLLDEPGAALDAQTREATLTWLIDTLAARRIPALAATHDPAVAGRADHLVLLEDGGVIAAGPPGRLYADPGTAAAARLLGFENVLMLDGALCAVRAADIEIAPAGLPARVTAIRPHGAALHVACAMPAPVVVLVPGMAGLSVGDDVGLKVRRYAALRYHPHATNGS